MTASMHPALKPMAVVAAVVFFASACAIPCTAQDRVVRSILGLRENQSADTKQVRQAEQENRIEQMEQAHEAEPPAAQPAEQLAAEEPAPFAESRPMAAETEKREKPAPVPAVPASGVEAIDPAVADAAELEAACVLDPEADFCRDIMYGRAFGEDPSSDLVLYDALIGKPGGLIGTILGSALFVATLPFTAVSGDVGVAFDKLVNAPASDLVGRPLGRHRSRLRDLDRNLGDR